MKTLLITLLVLSSFFANGQIEREVRTDTVATGFVLDTVLVETEKYKIGLQGIERIERTLTKVFDREKVETDTMLHLQESRQFVNNLYRALNQYAKPFLRIDTIEVVKSTNDYYVENENEGIIKQYQELNARIKELRTDTDIKYVDAVQEFQEIQEKKARLERIYKNIQAKEKK